MDFKEYMKAARQTPEKYDKIEYMTIGDKMLSNVFVNGYMNSPVAGCSYDADVTEFMKSYNHLKAECSYHLTVNALMMKVLIEGLKAAPRLNAHYHYNRFSTSGKLVVKKDINVSMAVCKSDGRTFQMKLPRLQDKSLEQIAKAAANARERLENSELDEVMFEVSRQRIVGDLSKGKIVSPLAQSLSASFGKGKVIKLSQTLKSDILKLTGKKEFQPADCDVTIEELNEGTVCFTNWGAICDNPEVKVISAPIVYPQVFLFSVGNIREEKYIYEDENGKACVGTKQILPLGLFFDHKIGGFNDLRPFIKKLEEIFKNPDVIYTW